MSKSLLEKAKAVKTSHKSLHDFTAEDLELIEAWIMDEVTVTQIVKALDLKSTGNVYCFLARGAREIIRNSKNGKK